MSESSTNEQTVQQNIVMDAADTLDTIMVAFAGFTVLVWDHLITFDDEVELVWKRDKRLLAYLFLINRYLTPLGFIVNLVAFTLPGWGKETFGTEMFLFESRLTCPLYSCQHFVRYEGAMTVIGTQIAGFIMFLRVRAIYNQKKAVVWSIMALFLVWLGVNAWLLTNGQSVHHEDTNLHSCTMIFNTSLNKVASASAWLPLLYDTYVFALTLYKTKCRSGHIVQTLLSDGILYYSVICTVNAVLTGMIVRAGPGVKNITAQLELLLTVAMVSRLTLNLRKQASRDVVSRRLGNQTLWVPRRPMRAGSGSARSPWSHPLTATLELIIPQRNSTAFRCEPASFSEHIRLSTIYPVSAAMTPATASLVSEEGPRFYRPEIEQGVEAV